ncbi:MmcQ/YjbR family DNA-binding protein [Labrys sp. WJW]|uniref:MmcQ/YjbR family DNA-binding protein n=1 Tax=Labrys sp. WJW TaxID=1737983 RepID=UPI00192E3ECA|nr:MmcQ/YjbR family DNA-binding protein [Labrys sp. WJW]
MMPIDWNEAVAHALSLPGAEMSTSYGKPAVKVNGRAFLTPGHEADSFCLQIDKDSIEMLLALDPETYWQSAHYVGWPAVLVREATPHADHVLGMIGRAHAWNALRPAPRNRKKA